MTSCGQGVTSWPRKENAEEGTENVAGTSGFGFYSPIGTCLLQNQDNRESLRVQPTPVCGRSAHRHHQLKVPESCLTRPARFHGQRPISHVPGQIRPRKGTPKMLGTKMLLRTVADGKASGVAPEALFSPTSGHGRSGKHRKQIQAQG